MFDAYLDVDTDLRHAERGEDGVEAAPEGQQLGDAVRHERVHELHDEVERHHSQQHLNEMGRAVKRVIATKLRK